MAIYSSRLSAIPADPLPITSDLDPSLIFSGPDCGILTVTLESRTSYQNSAKLKAQVRLQKTYVIDSANPQQISLEVKQERALEGSITQPLKTVFRLIVDPHLRNGTKKANPKGNNLSSLINVHAFVGSSAQLQKEAAHITTATEVIGTYETYRLNIRSFLSPGQILYAPQGDSPNSYIESGVLLVEFKAATGKWSFITVGSLLSDLFHQCPRTFFQLYIVGNHQISDIASVKNSEGNMFKFMPTGFLPTNRAPTPAEVEADTESKWDQFLLARAKSLKEFIFGPEAFGNIFLVPAVEISSSGGVDTIPRWSYLASRFVKPDGSPDIPRLRSLNLEKAHFAAGCIFLWSAMPSSLFDTEVLFQTDSATVYPNSGKNWENISANNRTNIDRLRQDLRFLVPGSVVGKFTTNLIDAHLQVEGYTDTAGGTDHNQALSEQRALSVIEELVHPTQPLPEGVAGGIPQEKFTPPNGIGYGETRLNIQTPNPQDEPRNRRVMIRVVDAICT